MTTTSQTTQITILEEGPGNTVRVRLQGKLTRDDYELFVPEIERLTKEHGKIRMLVELVDFHGWTAGAMWEDTKFGARHFADIERLAIVGDKKWEEGMAVFCKPFTLAKVHYFDRAEIDRAKAWLHEETA